MGGFPGGSVVKNVPADAGDVGDVSSTLGREDPPEKEMATRYSCLGNPMDREAWWLQSIESQRVGYN